jgi:hypothetical protein
MTKIQIILSENADLETVCCSINGHSVDFSGHEKCIEITHDLASGIHQLQISQQKNNKISVENVLIDGCSIRQALYLSWVELADGSRCQPGTVIWEPDQTWVLPFGCPASFWITMACKKLPNNVLGTDLSEKYYVYYPETMQLSNRFPQLIRDFFSRDFEFTLLPKNTPKWLLPYTQINMALDQKKISMAEQEILDNLDWIKDVSTRDGQYFYNLQEIKPSEWFKLVIKKNHEALIGPDKLPMLWQLIDSLQFNEIINIYVGILLPGGYLAPHNDNDPDPGVDGYRKHYYFYLPMNWKPGNYFKFAGAGILKNPGFMNLYTEYVHSVVNDTDQTRVVMGLWVNRESNQHIELQHI